MMEMTEATEAPPVPELLINCPMCRASCDPTRRKIRFLISECKICYGTAIRTAVLPCGHTMCSRCLDNIARVAKGASPNQGCTAQLQKWRKDFIYWWRWGGGGIRWSSGKRRFVRVRPFY
jgi:hypothetical protein